MRGRKGGKGNWGFYVNFSNIFFLKKKRRGTKKKAEITIDLLNPIKVDCAK